ncbi:uncharacterized protein LOC112082012 [Eutrema salsugineum]|uniref:uncharacterized protein LOC112082012 n=1 Tax=Eutrema salsugineum TaxID=72664 RepID=UPI000CED52EF|nr:uncharacterized protein LOC112082012 [Eutrema salsugineum]
MADSDTINEFSGKLSQLASKATALRGTIDEPRLVMKFLNIFSRGKFIQIVASLEQVLDLKTTGHFASVCPDRKQNQEANKVETEEADEALYMHKTVFLNEESLVPKKYEKEKGKEGTWYLENGASNHMTGVKSFFLELNENIKGKVKFGDGSCIDIGSKGLILFEGKTGEQKLVPDIYYILTIKSNILSLGASKKAWLRC